VRRPRATLAPRRKYLTAGKVIHTRVTTRALEATRLVMSWRRRYVMEKAVVGIKKVVIVVS
jgi:hypothetical protein